MQQLNATTHNLRLKVCATPCLHILCHFVQKFYTISQYDEELFEQADKSLNKKFAHYNCAALP